MTTTIVSQPHCLLQQPIRMCMNGSVQHAAAAVQLTIMLMSIAFAGWKPGVPQSGSSLSKLTRTAPGGMAALRCVSMVMQRWSSQSCRMLFIT
jgi:hypothetical protein